MNVARIVWTLPLLSLTGISQGTVAELFASPGIPGQPSVLEIYDDGRGPALYVAGTFEAAGRVAAKRIARWDGFAWETLGSGPNLVVRDLEVFDGAEDAGPALYAAGLGANALARWTGSGWSEVPSAATKGGENVGLVTLAVFDGGSGPELIVGGNFDHVAGVNARSVARFDGQRWYPMAQGLKGVVRALATHDDGSGPALYAAGQFKNVGASYRNLARWDGTAWSAVGAHAFDGPVVDLAEFGGELVAVGDFKRIGNLVARRIARWDGSGWAPVGMGAGPSWAAAPNATSVRAVHVQPLGPNGREELVVAGRFTNVDGVPAENVAAWNGTRWRALGGGVPEASIHALSGAEWAGSEPGELYAVGDIGAAPGGHGIVRWDGRGWSSLTRGLGVFGEVHDLRAFDDGSGEGLFVSGAMANVGGEVLGGLLRWKGSRWSQVGNAYFDYASPIAVFDDGSGPALHVAGAGRFGDEPFTGLGKWDGARWSQAGPLVRKGIRTLAVHDDGSGPSLYAGGLLRSGVSAAVTYVARWDGERWWDVGGGFDEEVASLVAYEDAAGPALFAAGNFSRAGLEGQSVPAPGFARWDGSGWSAVPAFSAFTNDLCVHDDGTGARIYGVGAGWLSTGSGFALGPIWRFDGAVAEPVGDGAAGILVWGRALDVVDVGGDRVLLASGGSVLEPNRYTVALWDGRAWTELVRSDDIVLAMETFDDGSGSSLFLGGRFSLIGGVPASRFARWTPSQ